MLNGKLLLISTGITFLLCGAVIYFCNTRLQHLEAAVLKQNQVLASFFATVQTDIKGQGQGPLNLATPEAVAAAQRFHQQPPAPFQKIAVSDTESLSDDSSSDDDSADESDSESVSDNNDDGDDSEIVSDSEDVSSTSTAIKIINLHKVDDEDDVEVDIEEEDDGSMYQIETFEINADVVEEEKDISAVVVDVVDSLEGGDNNEDFIKVVEIASLTSTSVPPPKYDSLKVDDLRKIVQDKKLATANDVKKMKKAELLALLVE